MRLPAFISATLAASAAAFAVQAAPLGPVGVVHVSIGPDLEAKANKIGHRDLDELAADLRESVERELGRSGALARSGGTLDLVIEDAVPNRPTFQQMSDKPGLSFESFGVGGAEVSGTFTTVDGQQIPISYRWYETDIRWASASATWSDAHSTFDRFARRLANGQVIAER